MAKKGYDFAGYVTRNNVRCTDGTIIRPGCFHDMNGKTVPLVWNHQHNDHDQILGHAQLEERPDGIYCYAYCNSTPAGKNAVECVKHGDINAFSIWANNLRRNANDILHGVIREISLVLAGADQTAVIDTIAHSDMDYDDVLHAFEIGEGEAEISFLGGYAEMITHADDEDEEEEDAQTQEPTKEDKTVANNYPEQNAGGEQTVADVLKTFNPDQKKVLTFLIGKAIEDAKGDSADDDDEEDYDEEDTAVKHNVFDGYNPAGNQEFLSHDALVELTKDAKASGGSLRDAYRSAVESGSIQHADDYGMGNIDYLFPDARVIDNKPDFITRNMEWVDIVLNGVHKTPFSRVKSIHADITEDEARAKGYIKGKRKKDEVFTLLKRSTDPQTIYKKQRLDKDDINDITDFDVVVWLKAEMQVMMREEVARAILIGDGRSTADDDKIQENHIRPIYNDDDLYTIKYPVEIDADATSADKAKALLQAQLKARKLYKGSGSPVFFTTEDNLTDSLLLENSIGERLYKSEAEVATAMRVSKIVTVEPMEGLKVPVIEDGTTTSYEVAGIDINLADYNVGTNGGAKTDFFDDFDIDYNQYKYLYETRMSGAMIKPYGCITFYFKTKA